MKIYFENKETSKERQLKAFLSKDAYERLQSFFRISREYKLMFDRENKNDKGNFVLRKK